MQPILGGLHPITKALAETGKKHVRSVFVNDELYDDSPLSTDAMLTKLRRDIRHSLADSVDEEQYEVSL